MKDRKAWLTWLPANPNLQLHGGTKLTVGAREDRRRAVGDEAATVGALSLVAASNGADKVRVEAEGDQRTNFMPLGGGKPFRHALTVDCYLPTTLAGIWRDCARRMRSDNEGTRTYEPSLQQYRRGSLARAECAGYQKNICFRRPLGRPHSLSIGTLSAWNWAR